MFCSTVVATIGRVTLARAVTSVLNQHIDAASHEVIVVNDSGRELPHEPWMDDARVRVISTPRVERSAARNAGIAIARGVFIHILDDDDVMLPGSLAAFRELSAGEPDAAWLYGAYETMDNDGRMLRRFSPDLHGDIFVALVAGEAVPLQASLLRSDAVAAVGGFDTALVGVEDRDLGRRLAWQVQVAFTTFPVAGIRVGQEGSTTDWSGLPENDRRGREKALSLPGAASRLRASTGSPFWRGRMARAYVGSALWHGRRGGLCQAGSRLAAAAWMAHDKALSPAFWQGIRRTV